MYTLWILIIGLQNALGQTPLPNNGAQPAMQPIATYRTSGKCQASAKMLYKFLTKHSVSVDVMCVPTGVSDPVAKHYGTK